MKILIAAGGTGGHIFPALATVQELQRCIPDVSPIWIGTTRNREQELCEKNNIPIKILKVAGITRSLNLSNGAALIKFVAAIFIMKKIINKEKPKAILAFGGYVCAPVLMAARLNKIPYFLQEQNSVPGLVNRLFSSKAQCSFLGFPLDGNFKLKGDLKITGTPVRSVSVPFTDFPYPKEYQKGQPTVFICGGSQGAVSMNDCLIDTVHKITEKGIQVIWQTGTVSFKKIIKEFNKNKQVMIFDSIEDMYPFYAITDLLICRAGASTLNEAAYFGLPAVMIPLPWSAENHQWLNAGFVVNKGWGIRIAQNSECGNRVTAEVLRLLANKEGYEKMRQKALDSSPVDAASTIVSTIQKVLE